jgi:cell division protein FtsN
MIMKRTVIYILAISIVSFSSCKKIGQMFGKTSMSQEEIDALVTQNDELQKQVKEDAAAYERELEALRAEYEQKLAEFQKPEAKAPEGGFYVVVGSFKNQQLADNYAAKIKEMGYEGNIVNGPSTFKLVTSSTHANLKEALVSLKTARSVVASKSWIYFNK